MKNLYSSDLLLFEYISKIKLKKTEGLVFGGESLKKI